jgi:signal transduction histidine kinase
VHHKIIATLSPNSPQIEEMLLLAQKMEITELLLAGVNHDLRSMMTIILGGLQYFAKDSNLKPESHELIETMISAGKQSTKILELFAIINKREHPPVFAYKDLNGLIREAVQFVMCGKNKKIGVNFQLSPILERASINSDLINRVIINLAVNAAQAMEKTKVKSLVVKTKNLKLKTERTIGGNKLSPGEYVIFSISDTGSGITPENIKKIFQPYFSTKGSHGTGLGMPIVYDSVVNQHKGAITLRSSPGMGTTITVYLPRKKIEE